MTTRKTRITKNQPQSQVPRFNMDTKNGGLEKVTSFSKHFVYCGSSCSSSGGVM